jgi:hypothetical protein
MPVVLQSHPTLVQVRYIRWLIVSMQVVEHMVAVLTSKILPSKRTRIPPREDPTSPAVNLEAERKIRDLEAELARARERSPPNDKVPGDTSLFHVMFSETADTTSEQKLQQAPDLRRARP